MTFKRLLALLIALIYMNMKIVDLSLNKLKAYERNPRKNDAAVDGVAASIREFGFKVPVVVDRDNVIVCGHTRVKAARKLGMSTVPCIVADDLTDEQIKAFRLADNKVAEMADWDFHLLDEELEDIVNIDMEEFGFELASDDDYYGDERERTYNSVNLHDYDAERVAGAYDMPIIEAVNHTPKDLMSFNYMLTRDDFDKGIHFYIDDYQFGRIWNAPDKYMDRLRMFDCVLTPDFSLYLDMPIAMQIWNVYRSRLIGQKMQDAGITVIPTLSWSDERSFDFCFDGLSEGGTVSVSTIGVKQDADAKRIWITGMDEAIARLDPKRVVVYGGDIGYDFHCETLYIENHNAERIKNIDSGQ